MDFHLSNKSTESIIFPIKYTNLVSIIGKCIISASIKTDGCSMLLEFENDSSIDIDGSDIAFECYSANWKGIEFVV